MKSKYLILVILLLIGKVAFSQQNLIDSLEAFVTTNDSPKLEKVRPLVELSYAYNSMDTQSEKTYSYLETAKKIATQHKSPDYSAYVYANMAVIYANVDSVSMAYMFIDTCEQYIKKVTVPDLKGEALMQVAKAKLIMENNDEVLDMLYQALDIFKETKNYKSLSNVYYMLYVYQYYSYNDKDMLKYAELSLDNAIKSNDNNLICQAWTAIGASMRVQWDNNRINTELLDSAMQAFRKAQSIYNTHEGDIEPRFYIIAVSNMASIYTAIRDEKGNYIHRDSVFFYADKALEVAKKNNDINSLISNMCFKVLAYDNASDFTNAKRVLLEALAILENKTRFNDHKQKLHNYFYQLYKEQGMYKEALEQKELEEKYTAMLFRQQYVREGKIADAKYKVQEAKQEVLLTQIKNKRNIYVGVGILVAFLLVIVLFWMKWKNAKQNSKLLDSEIINIELEKELEKERAERTAQEVNRLQKELIVGTTQLERKNDMLETIKNRLETGNAALNTKEISRLLTEENKSNEYFEEFTDILKNIHPDFYTLLQEKASQKLTSLDLKYCTYIYMRLTTKDIASLMFVEPKTVRMTKYRLKLKLELDKNEDLESFIQQLIDKKES